MSVVIIVPSKWERRHQWPSVGKDSVQEKGFGTAMALFLYFSVILSQAKIFVERLGDGRKGLGATVWLGGSSFLCRRKLLPLQGDGSC